MCIAIPEEPVTTILAGYRPYFEKRDSIIEVVVTLRCKTKLIFSLGSIIEDQEPLVPLPECVINGIGNLCRESIKKLPLMYSVEDEINFIRKLPVISTRVMDEESGIAYDVSFNIHYEKRRRY